MSNDVVIERRGEWTLYKRGDGSFRATHPEGHEVTGGKYEAVIAAIDTVDALPGRGKK